MNKKLAVVLAALMLLCSCAPGYYRSRQFNDLGSSPSIYTRGVFKR